MERRKSPSDPDTGFTGKPPRIIHHRQRSVDIILDRAGRKIKIFRSFDTGVDDPYGKGQDDAEFVAEELAVMNKPSPNREEEAYGERVTWEPSVILQGDSVVQEKDIVEFGTPRYPTNSGNERQLWEVETVVSYHTHVEATLQRYIEQN